MPDSILVAEDERASGEYLKLLLEEMGFEVRLTGNGVEALLALEAGAFDLVITDLRMPSMDGLRAVNASGPAVARSTGDCFDCKRRCVGRD